MDRGAVTGKGRAWAATVGVFVVLVLAGLGVSLVGVVLVYTAVTTGGPSVTVAATAYVFFGVVAPSIHAVRHREAGWRRVTTIGSLISLGASVVFLPFAAAALAL
jgi:hypothetical protein